MSAAVSRYPSLWPRSSLDLASSDSSRADSMSTMYQPAPAPFDSQGLHSYHPSSRGSSAERPIDPIHDPRHVQASRYQMPHLKQPQHPSQIPQHPAQLQVHNLQPSIPSVAMASQQSAITHVSHRASTPASDANATPSSTRSADTLVYHSLQIPKCISPRGGNLADFAAQMTCMFWFQTGDALKQAECVRSRPANAPVGRLPSLAIPQEQFQKWVLQVLSITQVTQNVILLALLFIYRLKMSTPQIKGRGGSEYRLLTVALMLGNKFLDDNTYTNKTWAEVSCFSVQEIHVMEVEFLSNMRYNLLASKEEWDEWLVKLACFHEFYDRAIRTPTSPLHIPSPSTHKFNSPVPSPTVGVLPSMTETPSQTWPQFHPNQDVVSPLAAKPSIPLSSARKRALLEDDGLDHPAKRQAPPRLEPIPAGPHMAPRPSVTPNGMSVPRLTVNTNTGNGYPVNHPTSNAVSLPPLQPGVRAMSTVYQQPNMAQPMSTAPVPSNLTPTAFQGPTLPSHAPLPFGTPNKQTAGALAPHYASSPMLEPPFGNQGVHTPMALTPITHSPIAYLQQRSSPYRPIRHVNTLLIPPPSASLEQYHLPVPVPVQPPQMHYQPLGRRHDVRTGVVPDFVLFNRGHYPQ